MTGRAPGRSAPVAAICALLAAAFVLAGCASAPQTREWQAQRHDAGARPGELPVELEEVPFYPQRRWHCGPAALATALRWSGVEVNPDALVAQVYVPERRGSFQPEMLAAARRHGRIPYVLDPRLDALIAELRGGHPVLVLQNLAWSWWPRWHYAVVIGYDPARAELVLRSGTRARHRLPLALFERTWRRGGHWAVVIAGPGSVPATASEHRWLQGVLALERSGAGAEAGAAWRAATERWPDSAGAWIGLGNHRYHAGDTGAAIAAFETLLAQRPDYPPALNNLAHALAGAGRLDEAEHHAARAVALEPERAEWRDTLTEIRAARDH